MKQGPLAQRRRDLIEDLPDLDYSVLLEASLDGILVVDADGLIRVMNPGLERMFNFEAGALLGQSVEVLVPDAARVAHARHRADFDLDPVARRMGGQMELIGRRADGSELPVDIHLFPVTTESGRFTIAIVRDATTERLAQRAVWESRELAEQLSRAQRLETVGRLAGGVAHDFNNLLQVIGGYAETLLAANPTDDQQRLLLRIRKATDRASALTRQLLAFGRRQVLRPQSLLLNAVVMSLESMVSRVIGEHIRLDTQLDPKLRAVMVDPGQIEQVLLNLAINARDAIGEDGGILKISTRNLDLSEPLSLRSLPVVVPHGSWVQVSVEDSGCGMDEETASRAFEPFFTTKEETEGSGLGLSMVYGIVKQSGGYTWIESHPGEGTTVTMIFPVSGDPAGDQPAEPVLEPSTLTGVGTILLVEDEPAVRELLASFLQDAGYVVLEAGNGREALTMLDSHDGRVDLIVTDIVMPLMGGPVLAQSVRASDPSIKILFVSGYAKKLEFGPDGEDGVAYVQKPVTRAELLTRVSDLLTRS